MNQNESHYYKEKTPDILSSPYASALQYIEEKGLLINGSICESYIDGVSNKDREYEWLTEIQIPV